MYVHAFTHLLIPCRTNHLCLPAVDKTLLFYPVLLQILQVDAQIHDCEASTCVDVRTYIHSSTIMDGTLTSVSLLKYRG